MTKAPLAPLLLAFAAAATLPACTPQSAQPDTSAVAAEVRGNALGVVAAYNREDAKAAAAFDAPDYVGVYHGAPNVIGPAADEAGMKAQMAAATVDWRLGPGKVTVAGAGDLAVFEAPYSFLVTYPQGGGTSESGTWIAIFKRQDDGTMKLWRSIASDSPAPKSTAG
jgi:ketosteroid isomerase-like protein